MPDVVMPKLSDSMEEGTILTWLKATGDRVEIGDELLEIETDKSTVTYAAEESGTLETLIAEGTSAAVGEPIARIGSVEAAPAGIDAAAEPAALEEPAAALAESGTALGSSGIEMAGPTAGPLGTRANSNGQSASATPLARRIAAVHGVALDEVTGTGPLGRITRADVLERAGLSDQDTPALPAVGDRRSGRSDPSTAPAQRPAQPAGGSRRQQPSRLQQLIARRMVEAKATVPHFQVQTEVVMDAAVQLRAELKDAVLAGGPVPSLNDIIIKAAALALRQHPLANGSYQDETFVLHEQINVGMAVAADDALIVPTIFDAAAKSLGQIATDTRALAARVRDGQISPAELDGGTFTVSNLGMFGMTAITPVINPPQAAILGVGALRAVLARVDGEIVDRTLLTLTLSCDHRILYGADAARFLAHIRELLEKPLALVL